MSRLILPSRAWCPAVPMLWIPRLEFAGWYPCCCEDRCGLCSVGNTLRVDLGVGGWVDQVYPPCTACATFAGEFDLTYNPEEDPLCWWEYLNNVTCGNPGFEVTYAQYLRVELRLHVSGDYIWRLTANVYSGGAACAATYDSDTFTPYTDCLSILNVDDKIQLDKTAADGCAGGALCDISTPLPDPVYMWEP